MNVRNEYLTTKSQHYLQWQVTGVFCSTIASGMEIEQHQVA
jgi:hypothetical protein